MSNPHHHRLLAAALHQQHAAREAAAAGGEHGVAPLNASLVLGTHTGEQEKLNPLPKNRIAGL